MSPNLSGKVCIVTGGSQGIGKGIALQLGEAGAIVYITGRNKANLEKAAQEVKERGAQKSIPLQVDHSKDEEVKKLFETVKNEQKGQLDILVNNAYAGVNMIMENMGKSFWESNPFEVWDCINGVGLRNHYCCTAIASRIMTENKTGLIINVSSGGGLRYLFNVAYGVGKAACDRMAADCAIELKKHNVAMVSLWPGAVKTEKVQEQVLDNKDAHEKSKKVWEGGESIEFSGKAITRLANDDQLMKKTGKILLTSHLATEYDFVDVDGTTPKDFTSVKYLMAASGHTWLAALVPSFVRIPLWVVHFGSNKF